jgi:hypothetical protein
VEGSCVHGNEPSGSIKWWDILEWLHNWRLLEKGLAPCVSVKHFIKPPGLAVLVTKFGFCSQ